MIVTAAPMLTTSSFESCKRWTDNFVTVSACPQKCCKFYETVHSCVYDMDIGLLQFLVRIIVCILSVFLTPGSLNTYCAPGQ
jgi:hypothetical protein